MNTPVNPGDPYKKIVKHFDRFTEPFISSIRRIGMNVYPPIEGMRVLDIGCGTGTALSLYRKAGCSIYGIDSSPSMLTEARNKLGKSAELLLEDASEIHFPDNFFDLVTCVLALHEMPKGIRSSVLNEMERVSKPAGRILLIDYHPGSMAFPKGWFYKAVTYYFEIAAGREHFKNFRDFSAAGGIPGLIASHNLTFERIETTGGGIMGIYLLCPG